MTQFLTALRFAFKEQLSNKYAFGVLVVIVPIWYWLLGVITPYTPIDFRFRATGKILHANGHDMMLISAGLNLLTMILGFMFLHSVQRALAFDRRLVRAGFGRFSFVAAHTFALLFVTAIVAAYLLAILTLFWKPLNAFEVWLGFWLVSLAYGNLGRALGMIMRSELSGVFFIVMFSMIDVFLQNPIANPVTSKPFLQYFPSYSAMQLDVAGGFTHIFAGNQVWLALSWFVGSLLLTFVFFNVRMRRKGRIKSTFKRVQDQEMVAQQS